MSNAPLPKWTIITGLAKRLGVTDAAIAKWRSRGVPPKWQVAVIRESGGLLSLSDFDSPHAQEDAA